MGSHRTSRGAPPPGWSLPEEYNHSRRPCGVPTLSGEDASYVIPPVRRRPRLYEWTPSLTPPPCLQETKSLTGEALTADQRETVCAYHNMLKALPAMVSRQVIGSKGGKT